MVEAVEKRFGPYRWGRYDILVLPPSFPFGGMENPKLTFATPTVLAGDRSLVSLIAHELAHSWSGNLVTNATWRDFWLNEGFTTYLERRIIEDLYGADRADDGGGPRPARSCERTLATLQPTDQVLHIDLDRPRPRRRHDPGPLREGRPVPRRRSRRPSAASAFDAFLRPTSTGYAFQSITTADFVTDLGDRPVPDQAPGRRAGST